MNVRKLFIIGLTVAAAAALGILARLLIAICEEDDPENVWIGPR